METYIDVGTFGKLAFELRSVGRRFAETEEEHPIYGITYIDDLRPQEERAAL